MENGIFKQLYFYEDNFHAANEKAPHVKLGRPKFVFLLGLVRDWGIFFFVFSPRCVPIKFSKFPTFPPLCSPPRCSQKAGAHHIFIPYALVKVEFWSKFSSLEINFQFQNNFFFVSHKIELYCQGACSHLGPNSTQN